MSEATSTREQKLLQEEIEDLEDETPRCLKWNPETARCGEEPDEYICGGNPGGCTNRHGSEPAKRPTRNKSSKISLQDLSDQERILLEYMVSRGAQRKEQLHKGAFAALHIKMGLEEIDYLEFVGKLKTLLEQLRTKKLIAIQVNHYKVLQAGTKLIPKTPVPVAKPKLDLVPTEPHEEPTPLHVDKIPTAMIQPSEFNPRVNEEDNEALGASIKKERIREPLELYRIDKLGNLGIADGHCRYRWAITLGIKDVPYIIREDLKGSEKVLEYILIKALTRKNLSPLEEARAFQSLLKAKKITQAKLAAQLGRSQAAIANTLRLLEAPTRLQEMIICRQITAKHVHTILPYVQYGKFYRILMGKVEQFLKQGDAVSVRELKNMIRNIASENWGDRVVCLNLNSFPYQYSDFKSTFPMDDCKGCKHIKPVHTDDKTCFNHTCWKRKINVIKTQWERENQERIKKQAGKGGEVNVDKLGYGNYERFGSRYDQIGPDSECRKCEKNKRDQHKQRLCIDPKCYKRKKLKRARAAGRKECDAQDKFLGAFDKYLKTRKKVPLRWWLKRLVHAAWQEAGKKALKPWGSAKSYDELEELADKIPEEDLENAIERVLFMDTIARGYSKNYTKEYLEKIHPKAAKFYEEG